MRDLAALVISSRYLKKNPSNTAPKTKGKTQLCVPCLVLDAVSGRDDVPPVNEDAAALALADPDEGLRKSK